MKIDNLEILGQELMKQQVSSLRAINGRLTGSEVIKRQELHYCQLRYLIKTRFFRKPFKPVEEAFNKIVGELA